MKRAFTTSSLVLIALLAAAACRSAATDLSQANTQRQVGVRMAKMNLWREAMFRFRRATEIEPGDAMSHNNLAVAYEANGDFEAAAREYREALRLDRSNQYIQKNYSRFVEFSQRSRKRDEAKKDEAAPAATATETATVPATTAPADAPPAEPVPPTETAAPEPPPAATPPPTDTAAPPVPPAGTNPTPPAATTTTNPGEAFR